MTVHSVPHIQYIMTGVSYMTAIISSLITAGIGFGLGWYVKGRGMTGVKNDLNNVKNDVEALKAKVMPVATPVSTPVV